MCLSDYKNIDKKLSTSVMLTLS